MGVVARDAHHPSFLDNFIFLSGSITGLIPAHKSCAQHDRVS
jgi:hypothetical protein